MGPLGQRRARGVEARRPRFGYEPLEGGNSILVLICEEILREAKRRRAGGRRISVIKRFADDLKPQIFRAASRGWYERDDKWAFPRSVLDDIATAAGAEVRLYGLHDNVGQFRRHRLRRRMFRRGPGQSSTASIAARFHHRCCAIRRLKAASSFANPRRRVGDLCATTATPFASSREFRPPPRRGASGSSCPRSSKPTEDAFDSTHWGRPGMG